MDGAHLVRLRWRMKGAWQWPAFMGLTVLDAVIGHALPTQGERESVASAALVGLLLNLIGVILLARPLGGLLRRYRRDLPWVVARNYGGTFVVVAVSAVLLAAGIAHHSSIRANERAMQEAITRAQAFIGDHAPPEFRRNVALISTLEIEAGSVYRECVPSESGKRMYCVIVEVRRPWAQSVRFGGYEPNSVFGQGVG
jgi:hypothetical protein